MLSWFGAGDTISTRYRDGMDFTGKLIVELVVFIIKGTNVFTLYFNLHRLSHVRVMNWWGQIGW